MGEITSKIKVSLAIIIEIGGFGGRVEDDREGQGNGSEGRRRTGRKTPGQEEGNSGKTKGVSGEED